ncbi:hypothetical protein [Jannaschia rubra]|uniref:hypothetical protein n=1 Tax=Jannaschia rubra TaxID=282197 RepID=UPI002492D0E0|nr:hypothetical protein [Jannaschia rubra]
MIELAMYIAGAARERRLTTGSRSDPKRPLRGLHCVQHDVDDLLRALRVGGEDAVTGMVVEPWRRTTMAAAGAPVDIEGRLSGKPVLDPTAPLRLLVQNYRKNLEEMRQRELTDFPPKPDIARRFGIRIGLRHLERDIQDLGGAEQDIVEPRDGEDSTLPYREIAPGSVHQHLCVAEDEKDVRTVDPARLPVGLCR